METTKLSGVKIEAQYKVEEYDILILSASKSTGLADWLKENGYNLPPQAAEVLEPYIKNDLKFFVVKVNLKEYNGKGFKQLRPIQIEYEYERFMLPIRLGMANANGEQDLIVYCLSDVGRVETVNYRTARIPTDKNVPEMVKANFGPFYKKTYDNFWAKEGKNAVVLEYFWDISGFQPVKCDPCPGPQLTYAQMKSAGAFWITETPNGMGGYDGPLYFTRLHARYNRQLYPQDFAFQAVPSKENFQGRYIVTHPAQGAFDCEEGKKYIEELQKRQALEWANYNELTAATAAKDSTGKNLLPVSTPNDAPPTGGFPVSQIFLLIGFAGVVFILLLGLERGLRYLTVRLR